MTIDNIDNWLKIGVSIVSSLIFFYKLYKKGQEKQLEQFKKELENQLKPFNERMDKIDKDRKEQHEETMEQIAKLDKKVDNNDIDVVRGRIVAFEQLCRLDVNNDNIKLHQYKTYYKDEDKWAWYHKSYPELNGEINSAIESINEHYKKAKF